MEPLIQFNKSITKAFKTNSDWKLQFLKKKDKCLSDWMSVAEQIFLATKDGKRTSYN